MSQKSEEYYLKLHQTISQETGIDVKVIQYLRSSIGSQGVEGLKAHLQKRISQMGVMVTQMQKHLESKNPKRVKKFESYKKQLADTTASLGLRQRVLNVLESPDNGLLAKILRPESEFNL